MSKPIQTLTFFLAAPIDGTQVDIDVKNLKDSRGNAITSMPTGASIIYVTLEPRSQVNQEDISFVNVVDKGNGIVTLKSCVRNLSPQPPYTALGIGVPHGNGAECIISNSPQFYLTFPQTDQAAAITALWTFSLFPQKVGSLVPTLPQEFIPKSYADGLAIAGAPDSSTIQKGIGKITFAPSTVLGNPTISNATPAVITLASHGLIANDTIQLTTSGTLPTGLLPLTTYYVLSAGLTSSQFQVSLSQGGVAINTSSAGSGTHTLTRTTPFFVGNDDPRVPTQAKANALVGTLGLPDTTNPFITNIDSSTGVDQSQTTRNASIVFGAADTTTNNNLVAESFVAGVTSCVGAQLYKDANTGAFTGTVTISLQADSAGSPSGVALATVTLSNAVYNALPIGAFSSIFASPFATVVGTTYWIVAQSSTADSANHPNLGTNSAGGYANGIVKRKNTTDGWTTVATIDLYFKILTALNLRIPRISSTGFINAFPPYGVDTGTTDGYQINIDGVVSYQDGQHYIFKAPTANTGNATLNINNLGAKNLLKQFNVALSDNDILAGSIIIAIYDVATDTFQMQTPPASSTKAYLDASGTLVTVTGVAETTMSSKTVPANSMGPNGFIEGRITVEHNNLAATHTATYRVKLGGTTILTVVITANSTSDCRGEIFFKIANAGVTNSQVGSIIAIMGFRATEFSVSVSGTSAIDTTAAQTLVTTMQASNAANVENMKMYALSIFKS